MLSKEKHVIVDFIDMVQREISTTVQTVPVYAEAKLKEDFDIKKIIVSENELKTENDTHKKIIVKLIEFFHRFKNSSSELTYSTLSLLLCLVSLNGTASTFIEVFLLLFFK